MRDKQRTLRWRRISSSEPVLGVLATTLLHLIHTADNACKQQACNVLLAGVLGTCHITGRTRQAGTAPLY